MPSPMVPKENGVLSRSARKSQIKLVNNFSQILHKKTHGGPTFRTNTFPASYVGVLVLKFLHHAFRALNMTLSPNHNTLHSYDLQHNFFFLYVPLAASSYTCS